jgi:cytochrome b561
LPGWPAWQRRASRISHALLYILMLGMPLGGWLLLSLRGDPVLFFGLTLPPLAAENEELAKLVRRWHGDIGRAGYALIGLHAAAALAHHYLWRDGTLRRMGPARQPC